ncbi:hypothetical protein K3728_04855 [Rhodobacteraceae bacterium M385]|nr:hypothetical protein K3728_04855 [Rhodobacteraceae bacterium M385]
MRTLKALALAATAALSLTSTTSTASADGYTSYSNGGAVQTWYAPGTGYGPVNVNYHGQGNGHGHGNGHGNGYGQQGGHGGGYNNGHGPDYYRVHGVASHDHLNVRHGPGVRNHVVYHLPYNARAIQVGHCAQISTSRGPATWCTVTWNGHQRGWVNARYLAEDHY